MLQLSSLPIVITDAKAVDNPIVCVNPAFEQTTGYRADEILGRNCRLLQNDDREQPGREVASYAVRNDTQCEAQFRNYRKDGQLFWTHLHIFPVVDDSGDITHFAGIQQDITANKEARDVARHASAQTASVLGSITEGCFSLMLRQKQPFAGAPGGTRSERCSSVARQKT